MALTEEEKQKIIEEEKLRASLRKQNQPVRQSYFNRLLQWGVILWSLLLFVLWLQGMISVIEYANENPGEETWIGIGMMMGWVAYFVVWCCGAIPGTILYYITKRR